MVVGPAANTLLQTGSGGDETRTVCGGEQECLPGPVCGVSRVMRIPGREQESGAKIGGGTVRAHAPAEPLWGVENARFPTESKNSPAAAGLSRRA